ncbi:MAG: hypothetical protein WAT67_13570 [Candidatus Contendobacter sp.]
MHLTCPCCGGVASIEAWLADRAAREAVAAALSLPAGLGDRLLRYLGLFRPRKQALSWDRAAKLLIELNTLIQVGQIERNGRAYPAPMDYWKAALDQMLERREHLQLPLKTHGYLLEIIVGLGKKAEDQRAAQTEVAQERTRAREGNRTGQMQTAAAALSPASKETEAPPAARAQRRPPPPEFKAMLAKLQGKLAPESAP